MGHYAKGNKIKPMTEFTIHFFSAMHSVPVYKKRVFPADSGAQARHHAQIYASIELGFSEPKAENITFRWGTPMLLEIKSNLSLGEMNNGVGYAVVLLLTAEHSEINRQISAGGKPTFEGELLKLYLKACDKVGYDSQSVLQGLPYMFDNWVIVEWQRGEQSEQTDLEILTSGDDLPKV